jgi:hypothetical protein
MLNRQACRDAFVALPHSTEGLHFAAGTGSPIHGFDLSLCVGGSNSATSFLKYSWATSKRPKRSYMPAIKEEDSARPTRALRLGTPEEVRWKVDE